MLPPPQTKEFFDRVLTLESECRGELESNVQSLSEISLLLSKTNSEVEKLANRELQMSNRVRDMEMHLDNYSREDIRDLYTTSHETQLRLFMMRSQAEQLQTRQQHVREYQEKLRLLIDLLGIQAVPQDDKSSAQIPHGVTSLLGQTELLTPMSILSLIEEREDERLLIAREINDGATQAMTNLMLRAEICSRLIDRDVNETRTELEGLKTMIKTSLEESRRLVYDLRPLSIEELGVVAVLRKYMEELKRAHGIAGSVDGPDEMGINIPMQLAIFRFVQAIMSSMLVEGGAYQLDVHLGVDGQTARILIEAIGLESERETIYGALDDDTMRKRLEHFGAVLTTQIRPNRGMAIEIDVPIPAEALGFA